MNKLGKQTLKFDTPITLVETASIVGPKEAEGPMAKYFDQCLDDEFWGEKTWEKAESKIIKETVNTVISKSGIASSNIDFCFAGDLLNQCISSCFGLREMNVPFFGVFGACSTFVESMCLGSVFLESNAATNVLCATSSHFCSAEKQFRFPLELGNQRPPTAQWTVTGSGAAILSTNGNGPFVTHITPGKIVDMGIKDANNMGAAMAPAAFDTLITHLQDTGRTPDYYDMIVTGDLGYIGKDILKDLAKTKGYNLDSNYDDCGVLMFDKEKQDTHSGGSGCACIRNYFFRLLFQRIKKEKYKQNFINSNWCINKLYNSSARRNNSWNCTCYCYRKFSLGTFIRVTSVPKVKMKGRKKYMDFIQSIDWMQLLRCFIVGGVICIIGQILIDKTKLTPARILVIYVTLGAVLGGLGIYKYLIDFAGCGATVPLTGFGANLAKGAIEAVKENGLLGAFIGGIKACAGGIAAAVFFGYIASLISKPKIKKQ